MLIIDASRMFKKGRSQNELLPEHATAIFDLHKGYADVPGSSRIVPLTEIEGNAWSLNIPLYVEQPSATKGLTVENTLRKLKTSLNAAYDAEDRLRGLLAREGLQGKRWCAARRTARRRPG